jgi:hypothetical protein
MKNIAQQWLATIVLLLIVGGGIAFGFFLGQQNASDSDVEIEVEEQEEVPTMEEALDAVIEGPVTDQVDTDGDPGPAPNSYISVNQYGQEKIEPTGEGPSQTVGDITFTAAKKVDASIVFSAFPEVGDRKGQAIWDEYNVYETGTFNDGSFEGQKLVTLAFECDGMCFRPLLYRFAWDETTGALTFFKTNSADWVQDNVEPLTANSTNKILNEINLPAAISVPGSNEGILTRDDVDLSFWGSYDYFLSYEVVYQDSDAGTLYKKNDTEGCLYAVAPDGSITRYVFKPNFENGNNATAEKDDGSWIYLSDYSYRRGGCGIFGGCYNLENSASADQLTEIAETRDGLKIYEVKNPDVNADTTYDKVLGDLSTPAGRLGSVYSTYSGFQKENAKTFDNFVSELPVLYFQDPLGRWVSLIKSEFQPPAECGKPVIYLYPEETQDIDVFVEVDEFTKTIPEHGDDGWHVRSTPNSRIFNYDDRQSYDYLFWEGHDEDKVDAEKGFMVAREEVPTFLRSSLKDMGFTKREAHDFIEFWEPVMLDNPEPYFFVSFVGTQDFNKVAPLTIFPKPDTLIRVFMYFDPVSAPYSVTEQELRPVERNGFTVFEWGGTSSRPWKSE